VRGEPFGKVHRGGLSLQRGVRGQDDLREGTTVGGAKGDTLDQLADAQPLGSDAIDGRDGPLQDVVEAAHDARPLEGQYVERLLDDDQPVAVAALVETDGTARSRGDVEALLAEDDLVAHGHEGGGQRACLALGGSQEVERQSLRRLGADPREPGERLDEPGDGLDQLGHGRLSRGQAGEGRR